MGSGPPGMMGGGMGAGIGAGMFMPPTTGGDGMTGPPGAGGFTPPAGSGGRMSNAGGNQDKDNAPQEPPYLTVPRYDFIVQFVWKETLLSQRLEKQASAWEKEKQQRGTQPAAGADLAANTKGGA